MDLKSSQTEVVGFDSTFLMTESSTDQYSEDKCTMTGTEQNFVNKMTSTGESTDKEVQTSSSVTTSKMTTEEELKLAAWLRKIMPALEQELALSEQSSTHNPNNNDSNDAKLKLELHQELEVNGTVNAACWLSVYTLDCASLIISYSKKSDEQIMSYLAVFEPRRNKTDGKIQFYELENSPILVQHPVMFFSTNFQNQTIVAASSSDINVYQIKSNHGNGNQIVELLSKVTDPYISGITFLNEKILVSHQRKIVLYKINNSALTVDKLMKIESKNYEDSEITCICSLSEDSFVVGLMNGTLIYCTTTQIVPQTDGIFNPAKRELKKHKFSVSSVKFYQDSGKNYLMSTSISNEIYFFDITNEPDEKQPKLVIKLPLSVHNKIVCTLTHIICNGKDSLEVYKISSKERENVVNSHSVEKNSVCACLELSRNESWLLSGSHNGTFQIFKLNLEQ